MGYSAALALTNIHLIDNKRVHPRATEAHQMMKVMADRLEITLPSFFEYTSMSSYIFPKTSIERLLTIGLVNNMLFYIDDTFDRNNPNNRKNEAERRRLFEYCFEVLSTGKMPDSSYTNILSACREIYILMRDSAPHREWLPRVLRNLWQHLNASTYNVDEILVHDDPVSAYIRLRELDSGMEPEINLIEYAYNIFLPDWVLGHEAVSKATLMCSRIGGLMNDVFSYEKEVILQKSRFNLLAVLQEVEQVSFVEAVDHAVYMLNDYTATFKEMRRNIPVFQDAATNAKLVMYYEGLANMINGTWHWQMSTNRYRSPNSPFPELRNYLPVEV